MVLPSCTEDFHQEYPQNPWNPRNPRFGSTVTEFFTESTASKNPWNHRHPQCSRFYRVSPRIFWRYSRNPSKESQESLQSRFTTSTKNPWNHRRPRCRRFLPSFTEFFFGDTNGIRLEHPKNPWNLTTRSHFLITVAWR